MTTCIIVHNIILQDQRDVNAPIQDCVEAPTTNIEYVDDDTRFQQFLSQHQEIRNKDAHYALWDALIEHLWNEYDNLEI